MKRFDCKMCGFWYVDDVLPGYTDVTHDYCTCCGIPADAVPPDHHDRARYMRKLMKRGAGAVSDFLRLEASAAELRRGLTEWSTAVLFGGHQ